MNNGKCECIGVATFNINGETKQFGLTTEDFDFLKEREVKLQERIDETSKHLEHVAEEKAKLENKLAVLSQSVASSQVKV
ncbi:hypothetical protein C7Y70_13140 [Pseudoalteromonas sp. KS88]|uniref:hypothetical protein n=1 Tax=Pseudoalteromonas sp. KS88 TaxID=2109918 RepID=UPI0010806DC4|nr:hypothetical protein [Pseudoalteromonas sp. KS88]TGE81346.1 hypothetical protein C7Y70_13140 [Pseudoalteromonas sp. KS88]